MKRLLVAVMAVLGLLASLLVVAAAAVINPASAQTGQNQITLNLADDADSDPNQSVTLSVLPAAGCSPSSGSGVADTTITDDGPDAAVTTNALDNSCNWVVNFAHADALCVVSAQALSSGGANVGAAVTAVSGMITLAGNGDATSTDPLRLGDSTGMPVSTVRFTVTSTCHSTFDPQIGIDITRFGPISGMGNELVVEIAPAAASTNPACTQSARIVMSFTGFSEVVESPASQAVRLVDVPLTGDTTPCTYTVAFPQPRPLTQPVHIRLAGAARFEISAASPAATVNYQLLYDRAAQANWFYLEMGDDGDGIPNQLVNVNVRATRTCARTLDVTLSDDPTVGFDMPVVTSSTALNNRCDWQVQFTDADAACQVEVQVYDEQGMTRRTSTADTVTLVLSGNGTQGSGEALDLLPQVPEVLGFRVTVTDRCSTFFDPELTVLLPEPASAYAGQELVVPLRPSNNTFCSQSASITLSVAPDGTIAETPASAALRLINVSSNGITNCSYTPMFPADFNGAVLATAADDIADLSVANPAASVVYAVSLFDPAAEITVNFTPSRTDDYRGSLIAVEYAPVAGSSPRCTQSATVTIEIERDQNNFVNSKETDASQAVRLVDDHSTNAPPCIYTATFPQENDHLYRASAAEVAASADAPTAAATYDHIIRFRPDIFAELPRHVNVGATIPVLVAPAPGSRTDGCSQETILLNGQSNFNGRTRNLITERLVDHPGYGPATTCEYTVTFPAEAGNRPPLTGGDLRLTGTATHTLSRFSGAVSTTYEVVNQRALFEINPTIAITIPEPAASFAGTEFVVNYAHSPSLSTSPVCTPTAAVTLQVGADGTVAETPASETVRLIGTYSIGTCAYTATFPAEAGQLGLTTAASVNVFSNSASRATYELLGTRFDPAVSITVTGGTAVAADTDVAVTFAPTATSTNPNCTQTATVTVRVSPDGTVAETPAGQAVRLLDEPAGTSDTCAYTATFPAAAGDLRLSGAATAEVSADSTAATATYAVVTRFDPAVALTLPTSPADFAGTDIAVMFAAAAGADPGCTTSATVTVRIANDGSVAETPASQSVRLIDDPRSGSGTCSYTATFPAAARQLRLMGAAEVTVSAASPSVAAEYISGVTQLDPVVLITVSNPTDVEAATDLAVTFAPVAGASSFCTQSATVVVRVAADGFAAETPAGQAVRLVNDPAIGSVLCSYTATFPAEAGLLRRTSGATAQVSGAGTAALATYGAISRFNPGVALTLPTPTSNFAGTDFTVTLAPTSGSSNPGCTQTATIVVQVASNGDLSESPASQSVRLVSDPITGSGTCAYMATFPNNINRLRLATAASVEVSAASVTAAATYDPIITMFDPEVALTLPTPVTNFAGTEFAVTYTPVAGSNSGCTQSATVTVRVASNGDLSETSTSQSVLLVNDPVAGVGGICSYTARFPDNINRLILGISSQVVVSAASATASATYNPRITEFDPEVALTLPTPASNFAGTDIAVTFAPAAGSTNPGCTQSATVTVRVASNGSVSEIPASQSVRLVDDPVAGVGGICSYAATFPAESDLLIRTSAATVVVSAASATAAATYAAVTRFDPEVSLTLPTPASNFDGTEFEVTFAPTSGSTNPGCTQSATVFVRVANDGSISETSPSQSVTLVDDPVTGSGTCAYTATFPNNISRLRLATAASVVVSASDITAAATYDPIITRFDPAVSLTLPAPASNFAGTEFAVTFAPTSGSTNPGCTQSATVTVRVASNGSVSETSASRSVMLVDDPVAGVGGTCSYTATFPNNINRLSLATAAPVVVSPASATAAATYDPIITRFDPAVSISLPAPATDFAGAEFAVTFIPTAGSTNPGCTQSATVTARVATDGSVSELTASQSVMLVDDPVAGVGGTCAYSASFPAESGTLLRTSAATVVVAAGSATAAATYAVVTRFDPAVALTLPAPASNFAGTEFTVMFVPTAGSPSPGCSASVPITVRVAADGSVAETASSQTERLVDDPVASTGGTCSYTATFPNDISRLRLATAASVEVSATSATAAATYDPIITRFDPAVALTLPAPASNFAGADFAVMFAPTTSSINPGCTQSATVTVRVANDGSVSEISASQSVMLVDDPVAGVGGTCSYAATFPDDISRLRLATAAPVVVSGSDTTAAATYDPIITRFDPAVDLTLPAPASNFAGVDFAVMFAPTASSTNPGCTQSATVTVSVANDGSVSETSASQSVRLVNDPVAGVGGTCTYTATFPDDINRLRLATAATVEVSPASATAAAAYDPIITRFDPAVALTLPAPASNFAGSEFAVMFVPTAGSTNPGCTQTATVTVRVASNGAVSETPASQSVRLVNDPVAGVGGTCSYTATFPNDISRLRLATAATVEVSAASATAAVTYDPIITRFDPVVSITLPAPATGYAGTEFAVTFVPTAGSTNPGCTRPTTITVRVGSDGSASETPASQAIELVNDPVAGVGGTCAYTATFPAASGVLLLSTAATAVVSAGSPRASAIYGEITRFDPIVSITLPAPATGYAGSEFAVTFVPTAASTNPGCTQTATVTVRVGSDGSASETPASQTIELVDDPITGSGTCAYTATFPAESGVLLLMTDATAMVSAASPRASAIYAVITRFDPAVALTLPDTAADFADTEFAVTFTPTAASTNPGCTAAATVTVVIAEDGSTSETPASQTVELVDDPVTGSGTCSYTATFPLRSDMLRLTTAAEVVVSAASATAAATYMRIPPGESGSALTLDFVDDADADADQSVVVSVTTVAGCNPGARPGLAPTTITDDSANSAASTGLLNNACNWVVNFAHADAACQVTAQAIDSFGFTQGAAVTGVSGMIQLAGNGDPNSITALRVGGSDGVGVNTIRFSVTATCHTTFDPAVSIILPGAAAAYVGTEFAVTFAPAAASTNPACTQAATVTVRVAADGTVPETAASQRVRLVDDPITGAGECAYAATFPTETGVLRRATVASAQVSAANPTATATYAVITVEVVVTSTYPADQLYTTADKATFEIIVEAPCGGFVSPLPAALGRLGDSSTVQVFPGTLTVYAPALSRLIVPGTRTFTTNAYNGANANQPCTVTVIERSGPDNCQAVGGDSQSVTYSPGLTALSFAFTHICTDDTSGSGGDGTDGTNPDAPPTPPSLDIPIGPRPNMPTG